MNKCLSPERGERVERLHFRDGIERIAEKLVAECNREEFHSLYFAGARLWIATTSEQSGPSYQNRLLTRAVRRKAKQRMNLYG